MNATIEKIIGLLFEDIEENEETLALREEMMTNCQERYADMLESGLSEDEAVHAVIESLNGMEDMLRDYPRKKQAPAFAETAESPSGEETHWTFDPLQSPIHEIRCLRLGCTDAAVEASADGLIHVLCEGEPVTLVTGIDAGVLSIILTDPHKLKVKAELSFDLSDLGGLFGNIARRFVAATASCRVRIQIPQALLPSVRIETANGDVEVDAVSLGSLSISTTSGDVLLHDASIDGSVHLTTASGDVTVHGGSIDGSAHLTTASGDAEWMGRCHELDARTASGDLRLSGTFAVLSFLTASGDVDVNVQGEGLQSMEGETASGDQRILLPAGEDLCITCRTRSGEVRQHRSSRPEGTVRVELRSSSGSITVR